MKNISWKNLRAILFLLAVQQDLWPRVTSQLDIETQIKNFEEARPFPLCLQQYRTLKMTPMTIPVAVPAVPTVPGTPPPPKPKPMTQTGPTIGLPKSVVDHLNDTVTYLDNTINIIPADPDKPRHYVRTLPNNSMTLDRITVPVLGAYNLRQWMHITLNMTLLLESEDATLIDFMIIQSVGSPLGLPFGEFRADMNCIDEDNITDVSTYPLPNKTYIIPCTFRPRASVRHPHIYIATGPQNKTGAIIGGFSQVHFNFNWINSMCQEIISMQFLILYHDIKNTDRPYSYRTAMTPVILLTKKDSADGIPYPFYLGWNESDVRCHGLHPNKLDAEEKAEPIPVMVDPCEFYFRIVYNAEFDKCIVGSGSIDPHLPGHIFVELNTPDRDTEPIVGVPLSTGTCPPGPFYCEKSLSAATMKNNRLNVPGIIKAQTREEYFKLLSRSWAFCPYMEKKLDCSVLENRERPTRQCFKTSHFRDEQEREATNLERIGKNHHALFMVISLFCQTLSVFYARFFKETGIKGLCGFRFWLWGHLLLTFLSSLFTWIGVSKYTIGIGVHGVLGYLSTIGFHINIVLGFIRPIKQQTRMMFIISHTVLGYIPHFLFVIAGAISKVCTDIIVYIIVSQVVMIVLYLGATYAPLITDSKTVHNRKIMPVPETLTLQPFTRYTIILAIVPWPFFVGFLIPAILISNAVQCQLTLRNHVEYNVYSCYKHYSN